MKHIQIHPKSMSFCLCCMNKCSANKYNDTEMKLKLFLGLAQ